MLNSMGFYSSSSASEWRPLSVQAEAKQQVLGTSRVLRATNVQVPAAINVLDHQTVASSIQTSSQYDSKRPVIADTRSTGSKDDHPRHWRRAGRTCSVRETQFESLHNKPPRRHAVGRTRSVDEAQIESPPNLLSDPQQAGHTSSVDATQSESPQMRNLRKASTNRAVDNPTTNRPSSRASGRKQAPFQRKAADQACTEIKQVRPTPSSTYVRECLVKQLSTRSSSHATALNVMCTRLGIAPPNKFPLRDRNQQWQLNLEKQRVVSALALEHQMSLQDIVEIVRAQSSSDPRPNKAMYPSRFAS
ncbi:unnamed protein product [Phytophthora fragariaefolia]|uniref:Unnamed protein product n=1 Tax=Phytophthora fragariaefolia TaxID=1490495 RepID=A0A9W6Y3R4_9STRA|nr:unnamed protein product [Phytophthora fragariaefolia]